MTRTAADESPIRTEEERCPRCSASMHWVHGTFQCPRCRFKIGCCEGPTAECEAR
jgi:hypothetical protein